MRYAVRAAFGLASAPPAGAGLPQSTGSIMPPRRRVAVTRLELGNYDNYFFPSRFMTPRAGTARPDDEVGQADTSGYAQKELYM